MAETYGPYVSIPQADARSRTVLAGPHVDDDDEAHTRVRFETVGGKPVVDGVEQAKLAGEVGGDGGGRGGRGRGGGAGAHFEYVDRAGEQEGELERGADRGEDGGVEGVVLSGGKGFMGLASLSLGGQESQESGCRQGWASEWTYVATYYAYVGDGG